MYEFDRDLQSATCDFSCLTSDWSINGIPNGGYIMAAMTRAMLQSSTKSATPILSASFINRCMPGPIDLQTEIVNQSRGFDRIAARLIQDGSERVRMMAAFAQAPTECRMTRYEKEPLHLPHFDQCVALLSIPKYTLFDRMDIRLDPVCAGWMKGEPAERSELKGWIRFKDGRPIDLEAIVLMADSFPPPVFASQGSVAWVPTLEMMINIRNAPRCFPQGRFSHPLCHLWSSRIRWGTVGRDRTFGGHIAADCPVSSMKRWNLLRPGQIRIAF